MQQHLLSPSICIWYSYVNDVPCFFFSLVRMCMCVCVCCLFLSCVFFPLYFLPSSHSLCIAKQKDAEILDSYFLVLRRRNAGRPSLFLLLLAWRLKGRLDKCHSCSGAMPLISTCSAFNSRGGETISLFPKQLNAL